MNWFDRDRGTEFDRDSGTEFDRDRGTEFDRDRGTEFDRDSGTKSFGLHPRTIGTLSLVLELAIAASAGTFVRAESIPPDEALSEIDPIVNFEPPPGNGQPSGNRSGGNRDCFAQSTPDDPLNSTFITLLLPETLQGTTVDDRPMLLAYIPQTAARSVRLKLEDEAGNLYFYNENLPVSNPPGIYQFPFPEEAPALESGRRYQWTMAVTCREESRYDDPSVSGWVERIEIGSSLESLDRQPSLQLAAAYAEAGLWFDVLAVMSELRQARPDDPAVRREWERLLASVGLADLAEQPLKHPGR